MIEIEKSIDVAAPLADVWAVLSDPHEVVSCISGARVVSENPDGTYDGTVPIRFGPMRVTFRMRAALTLDEAEHRGEITAQGRDQHMATRLLASASFHASQGAPGATTVVVLGRLDLAGRLASQLTAAASSVTARMTEEFAAALSERCAPRSTLSVSPSGRPGTAGRRWTGSPRGSGQQS